MPQALRRIRQQGAVAQEGWLPFKWLQRGRRIRRKAPQGGPLAPFGLRWAARQGQPALTFATRLAKARQWLR